MSDPRWCIGERHPEYGVVQAMGVTGGEAYRWFVPGERAEVDAADGRRYELK